MAKKSAGRKKRQPSQVRYVSSKRRETNRDRRVARIKKNLEVARNSK